MSAADIRTRWTTTRQDAITTAITHKRSQDVVLTLIARYRSLSPEERAAVDPLLTEDLSSDDESTRWP